MAEVLCSPPKLRRLVHINKEVGVIATSTPQVLPEPDKSEGVQAAVDRLTHFQGAGASINYNQQPRRPTIVLQPIPPLVGLPLSDLQYDSRPSSSINLTSYSNNTEANISSLNLESSMVDGAIDNVVTLPQMVSNVSVVQKGQIYEISRQLQILIQLETELRKEEKLGSDMIIDISNITKKIYITEDMVKEKQRSCSVLEKEIETIVTKNSKLVKKIDIKLKEISNSERTYTEYRSKMIKHRSVVDTFLKALPFHIDVENMKQKIQKLQERYDYLCENSERTKAVCGGKDEDKIKIEIICLRKKEDKIKNELKDKQQQIEKLNQQTQKVQQTMTVLYKRNNAQLTRLKCQVKDQQLTYNQWSDQVSHLNKMISDYKLQIEHAS